MADAARYEISELLVRDITLKEYLDPKYPLNLLNDPTAEMQRVVKFMGTRVTTSVASMGTGSRLQDAARAHGLRFFLRHPRHLNIGEFKTDIFIILGSRLSIPWTEVFESRLNYQMKFDTATWKHFLVNRTPVPGEALRYQGSSAADETWADIAVLPNGDRTGTILLFNAIDMIGIEAAGEFFLNGSLASTLANSPAKSVAAARDRMTEILLHVHSIGGSASKSEVVAVRQANVHTP